MKINYREIEFGFGDIESAVRELKEHKDLVCGLFNGVVLYSDIDDLNSAYKKVTGKTKSEFDEAAQKRNEEYKEQERKHKKSIPKLTEKWIKEGKLLLDEKYIDLWSKCVPIRLGDLYQGMELQMCLDIIKELNDNCELTVAKDIINGQGHSGMSFGLVCSMVRSFCDRGEEFANFVR